MEPTTLFSEYNNMLEREKLDISTYVNKTSIQDLLKDPTVVTNKPKGLESRKSDEIRKCITDLIFKYYSLQIIFDKCGILIKKNILVDNMNEPIDVFCIDILKCKKHDLLYRDYDTFYTYENFHNTCRKEPVGKYGIETKLKGVVDNNKTKTWSIGLVQGNRILSHVFVSYNSHSIRDYHHKEGYRYNEKDGGEVELDVVCAVAKQKDIYITSSYNYNVEQPTNEHGRNLDISTASYTMCYVLNWIHTHIPKTNIILKSVRSAINVYGSFGFLPDTRLFYKRSSKTLKRPTQKHIETFEANTYKKQATKQQADTFTKRIFKRFDNNNLLLMSIGIDRLQSILQNRCFLKYNVQI